MVVKKLLYQMSYEVHFMAISHYYRDVLKRKMTKKRAKEEDVVLRKDQYMDISSTVFLFPRCLLNFIIWS
jgi:hypothetical protein